MIGPELSGIDEEVANKMGILPIPLKGVKKIAFLQESPFIGV